MAQEFTIKSPNIEDKINQLLPSQGGFQAGVDFSASTMVVPVIDLTETAEGSSLRQDLQTSLSHNQVTSFSVENTTTTIINTTGYFRIFGQASEQNVAGDIDGSIVLNDGTTDKIIFKTIGTQNAQTLLFDFIVKLDAGDSCKIVATQNIRFEGCTRQIADINGNLTNP